MYIFAYSVILGMFWILCYSQEWFCLANLLTLRLDAPIGIYETEELDDQELSLESPSSDPVTQLSIWHRFRSVENPPHPDEEGEWTEEVFFHEAALEDDDLGDALVLLHDGAA